MSAWQQLMSEFTTDEDLVLDENVIAQKLAEADAKDPRDLLAKAIDAHVWATIRAEEAKALEDRFAARKARYVRRTETIRQIIDQLMAGIPVEKYSGTLASVSTRKVAGSAIVTDEGLIPDEYFKTERTLRRSDVTADLKDGVVIPGAVLSNGGTTIVIKRFA